MGKPEKKEVPKEEYFATLRLIAERRTVRVSRKTVLDGDEPTIGRLLAEDLHRDGCARIEAGVRGYYVRLTHQGETYLENVYLDSRPGMPNRYHPPAYDVPEAMMEKLKASSVKGAVFDPRTQRIGVPVKEWESVLQSVKSADEKIVLSGRGGRVRKPAPST
jgi:hypothetical protein